MEPVWYGLTFVGAWELGRWLRSQLSARGRGA